MKHGQKIAIIAAALVAADQLTKWLVERNLPLHSERIVVEGFFKLVHWGNTGAAWSMFRDNNGLLAIISCVALLALFLFRKHFYFPGTLGAWALGAMYGGIVGNLIDRLSHAGHVTDFLYFYIQQRGGREVGFPAFNIADMAICTGVGLLFLLSWQAEAQRQSAEANSTLTGNTPAAPPAE
ncbi:MAG TPA: signal peptidase II [Methylomirabilota bacterium]|nr:signal peptidase II [Methylomirabilota bacterium]